MMFGGRNMYIPGKEIIEKINAVYPLTQVTLNGEAKKRHSQTLSFLGQRERGGRDPFRERSVLRKL